MEGRCQCGTIRFTTPTPSPSILYICYCTECRAQSAGLFGLTAIFPAFKIPSPEPGAIAVYRRPVADGRLVDCYFCTKCGVRLMHHVPGNDSCSVKGGCLPMVDANGERLDWERATRLWTKSAVVRVEVPEGVRAYEGEPPSGSYSM